MILGETIQDRLSVAANRSITHDFDIRYLGRWIKEFPKCFPKYVRENNFTPYFNPEKYRWEILKGRIEIKFNPKNYL